jgi:hypothetical protein
MGQGESMNNLVGKTEDFLKELKELESELAGKITSYASGSGALSFVIQNHERKATGDKVTERHALLYWLTADDDYYFENFDLIELWGQFHMVHKIKETANGEYILDGSKVFTEDIDGNIWTKNLNGDSYLVKHISTLAAIRFYKANHDQWRVVARKLT